MTKNEFNATENTLEMLIDSGIMSFDEAAAYRAKALDTVYGIDDDDRALLRNEWMGQIVPKEAKKSPNSEPFRGKAYEALKEFCNGGWRRSENYEIEAATIGGSFHATVTVEGDFYD